MAEQNVNGSTRGRRGLGHFVLIGLALSVFAVLMPSSIWGNRLSVAAFGVLPIALGILRPNGFWDAPSVVLWRSGFGKLGVRTIYIVVGIAWIVAALAGKI